MATLTPQEEYNKQQKKLTRELELQTSSLRTPFRQLITSISETNSELGKIAADNIGKTQDTWTGLITQSKKERMIKKVENAKEYKEQAAAVKAQKESQAALETQKFNLERESQINRQEAIDGDEHLNKFVRTRKAKLEKQYLTASKGERKKINDELGKITATITERETFLAKEIDTKKEEESKRLDKQIKLGQDGVRESSIYIDETNEQLKHDLEKVSKSENFDKFQSSIKTLSFGIIDIAGVLDPISKQIGALKDLGSAIGGVTKKVTGGFKKFGNFLTKGRKESIESGKEVAEKTKGLGKSIAANQEKGEKGIQGLMRSMSLGALAIAGLILVVYLLRKRFQGFADWMDRWMDKDTPDQRNNMEALTVNFQKDMEAAEGDEAAQAKIAAEFLANQKELMDKQALVVKAENEQTNINRGNEVGGVLLGSNLNQMGVKDFAKIAGKDTVESLTDTLKPRMITDGSRMDMRTKEAKEIAERLKAQKGPSLGSKILKATQAMTPTKILTKGNVAMTVLTAGLTWKEIQDGLENSKTAEEKIDYLANNVDENGARLITEEEEKEARAYLEQKRKQDEGMPVWMSVAGGVGAMAVGALLIGTGIGAVPGAALVMAGGGLATAATGIGMDVYNQGDENLYRFLESKGIHIDPAKAEENLEHMKKLEVTPEDVIENFNISAEQLQSAKNALTDADSAQGTNVIVQNVAEGSKNTSSYMGDDLGFSAKDQSDRLPVAQN